jgi:hypothetical protein
MWYHPFVQQVALREILKLHFVDSKTRIMDDTLQLVAEVVRVLTTEATLRASKQAHVEGMAEVQMSHVEKILPQLVSVLSFALRNADVYVPPPFHFIPSPILMTS